MNRICGILVLGLTSSFLLMSCASPSNVSRPVAAYFATLGLVVTVRLKASVACRLVLFCSSSLALISKKKSSDLSSPVLSPCRLFMRIETITPETEYFGQMIDSPKHFRPFFYLTFLTCRIGVHMSPQVTVLSFTEIVLTP